MIELGVFSLSELSGLSGGATASERVRDIIDYGVRADAAGLDVFGVGEHHTPRFTVSSPAVVLAAIASRTSTITLTSAVSVLSVLDPVRLFQDFAQLDLVSGGRAEITAGRSAYTEPFDIFGIALEDYDAVFEEKLDLLLRLRAEERVTWSGRYRPALRDAAIIPRPDRGLHRGPDRGPERALRGAPGSDRSPDRYDGREPDRREQVGHDPDGRIASGGARELPVRLGVGGTPASAQRAARLGLPMTLAVLLGRIEQARPLADLYWMTGEQSGHARDQLGIGVVSHFFVGATSQAARDSFYPHYRSYVLEGRGMHLPRSTFDTMAEPAGALMVGSPQEIIDKIMLERELLGIDRFMGQVDLGGLPRAEVVRSIELFATEVAPVLRRELG